jgi:Arylsulfatase A and related enzymes
MKKSVSTLLATSVLLAQTSNLYAQKTERPNIIWITCEDISPYIGVYGDKVVQTPNIDALAHDGVQYNCVYTTAGVSAPSRSCFITGMYPTSIGTQHMRTLFPKNSAPAKKLGLPGYSAVIPSYVKGFPEYLRLNGYYTSNNHKEDYQFEAPVTIWDESSPAATYLNRPKDKPFFCVFNLYVTHESLLLEKSFLFDNNKDLIVSPDKVIDDIPPYYKNTQTARECMALMLSNIQMMDRQVGVLIDRLKKAGLYDNSYIFFFSDHGGAMPWQKREILERGTHIPFIIKFPKEKYAGTINNDLISSVDFAPTVLSIANVPIPKYMQGQAFLGNQAVNEKRKYTFSGRDRMDECYDRVRSVRDKRFRYIYNFMPDQPHYQDISYRRQLPLMSEMLELHKKGELNEYQDSWFKPTKPVEELYDMDNDPYEFHNLADSAIYKDKLIELRGAFRTWIDKVGDMSYMPEKEMIKNWWHGQNEAPQTEEPQIHKVKNGCTISCSTMGASIGYRILGKTELDKKVSHKVDSWDLSVVYKQNKNGDIIEVSPSWSIYKEGQIIKLNPGEKLIVNAKRIGYKENIKTFNF